MSHGPRVVFTLVLMLWLGESRAAGPTTAAPSAFALCVAGLPTEGLPDPFPIARVLVPVGESVPPDALGGVWQKMPRTEFEALVQAASKASQPEARPRFLETRYRAKLIEPPMEAGLLGTATWRIMGGTTPGLLLLEPLRGNLHAAKWADGRPALLTRPLVGNAAAAVWVDRPGEQTLELEWSIRGTDEPGEQRFDLRMPSAPISHYDLELPADRQLIPAQSELLIREPAQTTPSGSKIWRLAAAGRLEFSIRSPGGPGQLPAFSRFTRSVRHELVPGLVTSMWEFDGESLRGPLVRFEFETDPGVRVVDVSSAGLESWQPIAGNPGQPGRVVVQKREPTSSVRITLTTLAPLATTAELLTPPTVRPLAASLADDRIEWNFAPDWAPLRWSDGDYRLVRTATASDRSYLMAFRGSFTQADNVARKVPSFLPRESSAEFRTDEQLEWRLDNGPARLIGKISVTVTRGPLAQIIWKLPKDYSPARAAAGSGDGTPGPNNTIVFEPVRPLAQGQTYEARIDLRGPPLSPRGGVVVAPRLLPLGASERSGQLLIQLGTAWHAWTSPMLEETPTPLGTQFRAIISTSDADTQLLLRPRQPIVTTTTDTVLSVGGEQLTAQHRMQITIEPVEQSVFHVVMPFAPNTRATLLPPPGATVRQIPPLVLGPSPWLALCTCAPTDTVWQVRLPRPTAGSILLGVRTDGPLPGRLGLPRVVGAQGLKTSVRWEPNAPDWRADYRPAEGGSPETIVVRPRADGDEPQTNLPWLQTDGRIEYDRAAEGWSTATISARVRTAGGKSLPVVLPVGAVVEWLKVDGYWADPIASSEPTTIGVPMPAVSNDGVRWELHIRYPTPRRAISAIEPLAIDFVGFASQPVSVWRAARGSLFWPSVAERSETAAGARYLVPAFVPYALGIVSGILVGWFALVLVRPWRELIFVVAMVLGVLVWLAPSGWQGVIAIPLAVSLVVVAWECWRARWRHLSRAAVLVVVCVSFANAQPTDRTVATVYLVPNDATAAEAYSVLVAKGTLDRLTLLCQPNCPAVNLVALDAIATETDSALEVVQTLRVHLLNAGPQELILPYGSIRLEGATLDGKPAFVESVAVDRYRMMLDGVGDHTVVLRFQVPVVANGAEREARYSGPDLAANRLTIVPRAESRQWAISSRRGAQFPRGAEIVADLGMTKNVTVRWRRGGPTAVDLAMTVTEATIWDLSETEQAMVSAYRYRIERGAATRFVYEVPPGLEPGRVSVKPLESGPANGLRGWSLAPGTDGWQRLTIDLQNPLEGSALVTIRFVPQAPISLKPTLRVPRTLETIVSSSAIGVRLAAGLSVEKWEKDFLIDYPADVMLRDFPGVTELNLEKSPLTRSFRKEGSGVPVVRPSIAPPGSSPPASHELIWNLGTTAELSGIARWPANSTGYVFDLELPTSVTLNDFSAPGLAGYSRTGNRVRVWFDGEVRDPVVSVRGSWPGYPAPGNVVEFPSVPGVVRLRPRDGYSVEPQAGRAFKRIAPTRTRELAFPVEAVSPRFIVTPPVTTRCQFEEDLSPAGPDAPPETYVHRVTAKVTIPRGRPHHLIFQAKNLPPGSAARLELSGGVILLESSGTGTTRRWEVGIPAEFQEELAPMLVSRLSATQTGITLPTLELFAGTDTRVLATRTISVRVPDLRPEAQSGCRATDDSGTNSTAPVGERVNLLSNAPPPSPSVLTSTDTPVSVATVPASASMPDRTMVAAAWAVGLFVAVVFASRGPRWLHPESLVAIGFLAAVVSGVGFLIVAAWGAILRAAWVWGEFARRVSR